MSRTWYQVLDISREANPEQISNAYQVVKERLANSAAPDPGEELAVNQAFEVLSNPQRRAAYDNQLAERRARLAGTTTDTAEASSARYKWILGALVVLALITWMIIKKNAHHTQPDITDVTSTQAPAAPVQIPVAPRTVADATAPVSENRRAMSAEELYAKISPSVARIIVSDNNGNPIGSGSGVVVGTHDVITNCHVAKMGPHLELNIGNSTLSATVSTADEIFDLCMLQVPNATSAAIPIGHMDQVRTAQKVYAIGAPQGLELTISEGIVSSLRELPDTGTLIQTTAPISPGSSGGGLFDETGHLIGITTLQSRSGQNLNFAVPAEWIEHMSNRSGVGGVGSLTMANGNGSSTSPQAADPLQKVYGAWNCFDTVGGTNIDLTFNPHGQLLISSAGKSGVASYASDGKTITLYFPSNTYQTKIEELTDRKMILNGGTGFRTVCTH